MIGWIMSSKLARWLGGALVAILTFVGFVIQQRHDATQDAERDIIHEYERDADRRVMAGDEAVRNNNSDSPDDSVRANDSKWSGGS